MRSSLLHYLKCPNCDEPNDEPNLEVFNLLDDNQVEIVSGYLLCPSCKRKYPIINSIPRLLPDRLRGNLLIYHSDFFKKYKGMFNINEGSVHHSDIKQKTLRSFSYQWTTFSEMFEEYAKHFTDYVPKSINRNFYFKNKLGLDVGCGFGRHLYMATRHGAEMVGVDLSEAVNAAYANTRHLSKVHIVQGDIYYLPFKRGIFDFIYSIGVVDHLPDPRAGFSCLVDLLKEGQDLFIWCYDRNKPRKIAIYEAMRKVTTKLNYQILYIFCLFFAAAIRLFLNYPGIVLRKAGWNRRFPYNYYCDYPFRVLHADVFDFFSSPVHHYYNLEELEQWFTDFGLEKVEAFHAVSGWTIFGYKRA